MSDDAEDRDIDRWLGGIDAPRPLPRDLADELTGLLGRRDPVAALPAAAGDDRPLPTDLRARLEATLVPDLPDDVRRRIRRVLPGNATGPRVLRIAAVVVAVLLVAGGLAFAAGDRGGDDLVVDADTDGSAVPGAGVDRMPGPTDDDVAGELSEDAGVVATGGGDAPTTTTTAAGRGRPLRAGGGTASVPPPAGDGLLVAYANCEDLLGRTKAAALEAVGPYGLQDGREIAVSAPARSAEATSAPAMAGGAEAVGSGDAAASTTNVQEEGVDEPDLVKSDGRRIVTITDRVLRVTRDEGGGLRVVGSLELPAGAGGGSILVDGDRAVVLGWTTPAQPEPQPASDGRSAAMTSPGWWRPPQATLWTVDLSDAGALRIESTLIVDGAIAAARLVDGRVRLALTSTTIGPDWVYPTDGTDEARQRALEENRRLVRESTLEDWLPSYSLLEGTAASTARRGRLCACDDTLRPEAAFAGASTLSVVTFDPHRPDQPPIGSAAVQGWAETVYASRTSLYATTRTFANRFDGSAPTAIHRFDIRSDAAVYRGSGEVAGVPLNQFALSERNGHLRVATTDFVAGSDGRGSTESFVSVLAVREDRLEGVGRVGGLGKGERIFAVRFLDDVGYVVTFRQTDPLYTVDVSDPAHPRLRGELKIPGFSAYLHPVGPGRLLGVGQDATEDGRATGAQVSSFDVRSLDEPKEVARVSYGSGSMAEAQHDHHAFLWWAAAGRAMLPVVRTESQGDTYRQTSRVSVVAVPADGRIHEVGAVTHDGRAASSQYDGRTVVRRSFVVGDVLYTLSAAGILASDLGSLADRSWVAFG